MKSSYHAVILVQHTDIGDVYQGRFGDAKRCLSGNCVEEIRGADRHAVMRETNRRGRVLAQSCGTSYRPIHC